MIVGQIVFQLSVIVKQRICIYGRRIYRNLVYRCVKLSFDSFNGIADCFCVLRIAQSFRITKYLTVGSVHKNVLPNLKWFTEQTGGKSRMKCVPLGHAVFVVKLRHSVLTDLYIMKT